MKLSISIILLGGMIGIDQLVIQQVYNETGCKYPLIMCQSGECVYSSHSCSDKPGEATVYNQHMEIGKIICESYIYFKLHITGKTYQLIEIQCLLTLQ